MDPALSELLREPPVDQEVEAILRLSDPAARTPGVRIISRFGPIATCRLPVDRVLATRALASVVSLKAPRLLGPEPSVHEAHVDSPVRPSDLRRPLGLPYTGRGVVVGFLDWGFAFASRAFRHADGRTRLLALWDQRADNHERPNHYGYGTIHDSARVNAALAMPDPYRALNYHPADSDPAGIGAHGSHTVDIAVGNGLAGGPMGVAPEAEIVCVHLATEARGADPFQNLGDSVRVLEAIDFIRRVAGARPFVVSASIGRHGGPHDGTTLVELGADYLAASNPNCICINSAGNYHTKCVHASGRLRSGELRTLRLIVDPADRTPNEIEIWYDGGANLAVCIQSPDGDESPWIPLGRRGELTTEGRVVARIYHRERDPQNNANLIDIFVEARPPAGEYRLTLRADRVPATGVEFHAWVERDDGCGACQAQFHPDDADSSVTISTLANARGTISVGAVNQHAPDREIAAFSSAGPTRDSRTKPDCVAPGVRVLAMRSPGAGELNDGMLVRRSGTSMAAPHVAGCAALLLEAGAGALRAGELRELILSTTDPPPAGADANRYGRGYLNIERAVSAAHHLSRRRNPARRSLVAAGDREDDMPNDSGTPSGILELAGHALRSVHHLSSDDLLRAILKALGISDLALPARAIFRTMRAGPTAAASPLADRVQVIARPSETFSQPVAPGDVIVRRALGEGGLAHVAIVAGPELHYDQLSASGLTAEDDRPGWFVQVLEGGPRPHGGSDRYARRVRDAGRRGGPDQLILRFSRPEIAQPVLDSPFSVDDGPRAVVDNIQAEQVAPTTVRVRNRLRRGETVSACALELTGTAIRDVTNANGAAQLDLNGVADGDYVLRVTPANWSNVPVGPALATTTPRPDRIWRPLESTLTVRGERVTAASHPDTEITGGTLRVNLQPVWMRSPNASARALAISHCVIHHTAGPRIGPALETFLNANSTSAHYVIDTDGQIVKMVHESQQAFHAGASHWTGRDGVNGFSIGIEIVHASGALPEAQYDALLELLARIQAAYPALANSSFIAHSDIGTCPAPNSCEDVAPRRLGRKSGDPGLDFEWSRLERAGFGMTEAAGPLNPDAYGRFFESQNPGRICPGHRDSSSIFAGVHVLSELQGDLRCIGYYCPDTGVFDTPTFWAVSMFQERFMGGRRTRAAHQGEVDRRTATAIKGVASLAPRCLAPATASTAEDDGELQRSVSRIEAALRTPLQADDLQGIQARRQRLREAFGEVPQQEADRLRTTLANPRSPDPLAKLFRERIAEATRQEMLGILSRRASSAASNPPQSVTPPPTASTSKRLPAAFVTAASATIRKAAESTADLVDTLPENFGIETIHDKREVAKDMWWYEVEYALAGKARRGWVSANEVTEVAQPDSFTFKTTGGSGTFSPFEDLRKAVASHKLEPHIARLVNGMNLVILPTAGITLSEFVGKSYYLALIAMKGDFKKAALLCSAAAGAFKPSTRNHAWVQSKQTASPALNPATFRDKVWHFFWNAYERFDGTGRAWLDYKGIAHELKSRSSPVTSFIKAKDLSRDAKEDIAYNRAGSAFAEWIDRNHETIIKHHYEEIEREARAALAADPDMSKLPDSTKNELITKVMQDDKVQTERQKRAYTDFSEYAAKHIDLALEAIANMSQ